MDAVFGRALTAAMLVMIVLLIAYQVFMLRWTKKTSGSVPGAIKVLRGVNLTMLIGGLVLILYKLVVR